MFNEPLKARTNLKKWGFGLKPHAVGWFLCQESLLSKVVDIGQSKAKPVFLSPCLPECEIILTLF